MQAKCAVLIVDGGIARFLRFERGRDDVSRVVTDETIEQDPSTEHERGRPSPRRGKGGHTYASPGHDDDERRSRFAREVAVWVERISEPGSHERIAVFSPPRFLGALRDAWSSRLALRVDEHLGDLVHLAPDELARSKPIARLLRDRAIPR